MPNIVDGATDYLAQVENSISSQKYTYEYPGGMDLSPSSDLHKKIVAEVMKRARASASVVTSRHSSWNQIDRVLTAYIPLDEAERIVKRNDPKKPVSIVVPYSYAIMETLLTYLVASLLQDPILRYEGAGPEDSAGATLLTHVIAQQSRKAKLGLQLHTMFRDCLAYGIGPTVCTWSQEIGKRTVRANVGTDVLASEINFGSKRTQVETVVYEGNKLKNIDPYVYLPDPSVSIHSVQDGEFVGWVERTNTMDLLSREKNDSEVFNVKYLKHFSPKTCIFSRDESKRNERFGGTVELSSDIKSYADVIYMYVKIIPKEWGLGNGKYPEKWLFAVAGDAIVIEARPLGLDHDKFPICIAAPDYDGYSITPISRIEMVYGLQTTIDWLFSSHITNVRKAINDTLIVDPYLVNMADLEDPQPGKLVRLRRAAWGKGVKDAVQQLQVNDITKQHISDSSYLADLMQRVSAASDGLMGARNRGSERITATEVSSDKQSALSRLERIAKVISMQAMQDIGFLFASHTQQLMSEDVYVKISGEWPKELQDTFGTGYKMVSPLDLLVDYDVIIKDGSIPSSVHAETWIQLYQILAQNPQVGMQFDMVRVFNHIAQMLGAKDIKAFQAQGGQINASVMPNEEVTAQADAGNLVPMPMAGGKIGA